MRITNGIMINNTLNNINNNKILLDKLNTQLASKKKIQRPSEDPIIAIRALRFRATLRDIDQYLNKNIPDARSWMESTEDALQNTVDLLESIVDYITQGTNGSNGTTDREIDAKTLQQYRDQIYSEANADLTGRTLFSGYKTDTNVTFASDEPDTVYAITQNFSAEDIATVSKIVNGVDVSSLNAGNIDTVDLTTYETPNSQSVYRLRLGYDSLSETGDFELTFDGTPVGSLATPITVNRVSATDANAYTPAAGEVNYIAETGEVIFGADAYKEALNYDQISVSYVKTGFKKGELEPQHFFNCYDMTKAYAANPAVIADVYAADPALITGTDTLDATDSLILKGDGITRYTVNDQEIKYEVNFNQDLKINTQASEVYTHDMTRDMDDLIDTVNEVSNIEDKISKLNTLLANETDADNIDKLNSLIELANRELDFANNNMQKKFESSITTFQNYQEKVSLAKSDVGARLSRLTLNETRLTAQQLTVKDLQTNNENVKVTDIAVEISDAQDVYDASLAAAAKVVQHTLLDFI